MPTYTVTEVVSTRPWTPAGETEPKTIYYDVKVEGENRVVNVGRKPGNPLTPGTVLEGTLTEGDRGGLKFTRSNNGFGGRGGGRSPEENARIVRQHSQEMALRYAALRVEKELLPEPFKLSDLRAVIDWFDADAKAAKP